MHDGSDRRGKRPRLRPAMFLRIFGNECDKYQDNLSTIKTINVVYLLYFYYDYSMNREFFYEA